MTHAATRARLLELRRSAEAARRGRELLDEKREALLREVLARRRDAEARRRAAGESLARARALLTDAEIELGADRIDAGALAQLAERRSVALTPRRVAGARLSAARLTGPPFRLRYGPGGTGATLDRAAQAFADAVGPLVELAESEDALARLSEALAKTNRRLNALEKVILPSLARDIARTAGALEEEERDQWVRCRRAVHAARA